MVLYRAVDVFTREWKKKTIIGTSLIQSIIKSCVTLLHFHNEFAVRKKWYKFLNMNFLVNGYCVSFRDYCLLINMMKIFYFLSGEYIVEFTVQCHFAYGLTSWIRGRQSTRLLAVLFVWLFIFFLFTCLEKLMPNLEVRRKLNDPRGVAELREQQRR